MKKSNKLKILFFLFLFILLLLLIYYVFIKKKITEGYSASRFFRDTGNAIRSGFNSLGSDIVYAYNISSDSIIKFGSNMVKFIAPYTSNGISGINTAINDSSNGLKVLESTAQSAANDARTAAQNAASAAQNLATQLANDLTKIPVSNSDYNNIHNAVNAIQKFKNTLINTNLKNIKLT